MTNIPQSPKAVQLLRDLQQSDDLKHVPTVAAGLPAQLAMLRAWQADRLAHTYADLLADPHDRPACEFFLSDVYAPRDFSQRDHDLERIHQFLARVLPATTIQLITQTVELNTLTTTLDQRLLNVLIDQLGVTDTLTAELYAEAYRLCDNYAERVHQIDLTHGILIKVGQGARRLIVGVAMTVAKIPAQTAGWVEIYDFLERGYAAFRQMKDAPHFVTTIAQRELGLLDRMYADDVAGFKTLAGLS